jgi:hypothetical protein
MSFESGLRFLENPFPVHLVSAVHTTQCYSAGTGPAYSPIKASALSKSD